MDALQSDLVDIQGGTTGEGIHCGVMAGTVYTVLKVFCGLDVSGDIPGICPDLPDHWTGLAFKFRFRKASYRVTIHRDRIEITAQKDGDEDIFLHICGEKYLVDRKGKCVVKRK
jgi:trehalose/maltose hydrolase-like predicted phosphorylase